MRLFEKYFQDCQAYFGHPECVWVKKKIHENLDGEFKLRF